LNDLRATCQMGSSNVTGHPTQMNPARLNPSQTGWYSIYLPRGRVEGWVGLWLWYGLPVSSHPSK